jgi:hypothetical protein
MSNDGQSSFERALRIVHEGLRGARENTNEVRAVANQLKVSFFDVIAIAKEIVEQSNLEEVSETT